MLALPQQFIVHLQDPAAIKDLWYQLWPEPDPWAWGRGRESTASAGLSSAKGFISNGSPDDHLTAQELTKSSETVQARNRNVNIAPIAKTEIYQDSPIQGTYHHIFHFLLQ